MKNIKIVLLKPSEWLVYKTIQLEALKENPQSFGASYKVWINFSDEKWKERPSNKNSMIFVAKDDDTPIGLVGVYMENDRSETVATIWGMYVQTIYRGKSIGRALLKKALDEIKKNPEVKTVKLMVEYEPTPAQLLYT